MAPAATTMPEPQEKTTLLFLMEQWRRQDQPFDYALAYIARGWHVFPAPPTGEKKGLKSAKYSNGARWGSSNNPAQVRNDFTRWPNANVGIVCGADSGIWVLDIDTAEATTRHDGFASLAHLETIYGPLPATLTALSPSGSQHRYYRHPG